MDLRDASASKNTKKVQNQFEKAVEESVASQHEEFELNPVLIVN